jgi:hypothetical protein
VPQEDKASNSQLLQNPNGWVTWLAHQTIRCRTGLSGAPIDSSHPNGCLVVEGYKHPQPPPLHPSNHSTHCIQYKSNRLHSKDTNLSDRSTQSPQFNSSALGLMRGSFVFLCCSCLLSLAIFSLSLLTLKCFVSDVRDTNCVVVLAGSK